MHMGKHYLLQKISIITVGDCYHAAALIDMYVTSLHGCSRIETRNERHLGYAYIPSNDN